MPNEYPTNPEKLVLYKFDTCPFCQRVMRYIDAEWKGVPIEQRDIHASQEAYEELVSVGGMGQVPCLFVDGVPMYESADIVAYLKSIN